MRPEVKATGSSYCCQQLPNKKVERGPTSPEGPVTGQEATDMKYSMYI